MSGFRSFEGFGWTSPEPLIHTPGVTCRKYRNGQSLILQTCFNDTYGKRCPTA